MRSADADVKEVARRQRTQAEIRSVVERANLTWRSIPDDPYVGAVQVVRLADGIRGRRTDRRGCYCE